MKNRNIRLLMVTFIVVFQAEYHSCFAQDYLPTSTSNQIVKHTNYVISYDERHEQAEWVAYRLNSSSFSGDISRTNNFRPDPDVLSGSAALADYKGSGYDRGHLCPAGDMTFSKEAMSESFYLSNMSPQDPSFNRGIWKKIESLVRSWAVEEELIVITGPVFKENKGSIGPNEVTVPGSYFKVIFDVSGKEKMIGFVLPNEKGDKELKEYAVSVDEVELLTGIDFFYQMLPDKQEEELESLLSLADWGLIPQDLTAPEALSTDSENNKSSQLILIVGIIIAIILLFSYIQKASKKGKRK